LSLQYRSIQAIISISIALVRCTFLHWPFISLAPASYAQAHIWLDERARSDPENSKIAIYNMPFLYRLSSSGTISITQLRRALQLIVIKHSSLRTSLIIDIDENLLMQRIIEPSNDDENNKLFAFVESTFETDEELNAIMYDERSNPNHFDLYRGLVFRCRIVHHKKFFHNDHLCEGDALIFNFHHALFDFHSMHVFLHDLGQAYTTGQLTSDENTTLRYIDCKFNISSFHVTLGYFSVLFRCCY
jgi:hypothetical protein